MPTYRYRCAKCGDELEIWQSFDEKPKTRHAGGCGGKLDKVLSPAGIVLKGSGFYKTDNRSSSKNGKRSATSSESGSSSSSDSGSSSSDTKSDSGSKRESGSKRDSGSKSGSGSKSDSGSKSGSGTSRS